MAEISLELRLIKKKESTNNQLFADSFFKDISKLNLVGFN